MATSLPEVSVLSLPYPVGSSVSKPETHKSVPAVICEISIAIVSGVISGVSAYRIITGRSAGNRSRCDWAARTASAVPFCCFWIYSVALSDMACCSSSCSGLVTTRISVHPACVAASITHEISALPAISCRGFARSERILVPLPAARIMTVNSMTLYRQILCSVTRKLTCNCGQMPILGVLWLKSRKYICAIINYQILAFTG